MFGICLNMFEMIYQESPIICKIFEPIWTVYNKKIVYNTPLRAKTRQVFLYIFVRSGQPPLKLMKSLILVTNLGRSCHVFNHFSHLTFHPKAGLYSPWAKCSDSWKVCRCLSPTKKPANMWRLSTRTPASNISWQKITTELTFFFWGNTRLRHGFGERVPLHGRCELQHGVKLNFSNSGCSKNRWSVYKLHFTGELFTVSIVKHQFLYPTSWAVAKTIEHLLAILQSVVQFVAREPPKKVRCGGKWHAVAFARARLAIGHDAAVVGLDFWVKRARV